MLTKNGFFHIIETNGPDEASEYFKEKNKYLVLVDSKVITNEMIDYIKNQKEFLIMADSSEQITIELAVKIGVKHILSYPLYSKKLINKMNSLI